MAGALVLVGVGVWVNHPGDVPDEPPPVPVVTARTDAAPMPIAQVPSPPRPLVPEPRREPGPADELAAGPPGTVPVCGAGRVPTADGYSALYRVAQRQAAAAEAIARGMTRSDDPRVRAAGLYIAPPSEDRSAQGAEAALAAAGQGEIDACTIVPGPSTTDSPACRDARAQRAEAAERHDRVVRNPQHHALRRMAETADDPAVAAIGLQACLRQGPAAAPCEHALAQRWARLDPGNGWTALAALDAAQQAGDRGAVDAALARIAAAPRFESPDRAFLAAAAAALPADADPALRTVAVVDIVGREAAWAATGTFALGQACSETAVRDANRRPLCRAAADALAERGDTLLIQAMAASLGARSGWDTDRVAGTKARVDALQRAQLHWTTWGAAPIDPRFTPQDANAGFGCGQSARLLRRVQATAAEGEVAALERLLAEDGVDWRAFTPKPR